MIWLKTKVYYMFFWYFISCIPFKFYYWKKHSSSSMVQHLLKLMYLVLPYIFTFVCICDAFYNVFWILHFIPNLYHFLEN